MSVGHVARGLEENGIATVTIAVRSFQPRMKMMSLPRVLLTNNLVGRVLGKPHEGASHKQIILQALSLFEKASKNGLLETAY